MSKTVVNSESGKITSLRISDAIFSYAYLISPRPEGDFNAGTYGTELVIDDAETIELIKAYITQTMQEGKTTAWNNKIPAGLNIPLKKGNAESELEADKMVFKTSSKLQPKIFIRNEAGHAHEVGEDELDEIYSGMIGDAIVVLRPYNYNGICGIKAYVNAVCKTGDGEALAAKIVYEDEFSLSSDFDTAPAPAAKKQTSKKVEAAAEPEVSLDDLIATDKAVAQAPATPPAKPKAPATPPAKTKAPATPPAKTEISLDDLLK